MIFHFNHDKLAIKKKIKINTIFDFKSAEDSGRSAERPTYLKIIHFKSDY